MLLLPLYKSSAHVQAGQQAPSQCSEVRMAKIQEGLARRWEKRDSSLYPEFSLPQ
jgi:hypothetical protein